MSQCPTSGDDASDDMAISYASGLPTGHTQTLPSFRELLPPHLHDEIESTSYYSNTNNNNTPRHHPHERPLSSQELLSDVRSAPGRSLPAKFGPGYANPALIDEGHPRNVAEPGAFQQARLPGSGGSPAMSGSTLHHPSRGPSPILPPIRDLHSLPDRNLNGMRGGSPFATTADIRSAPIESHGMGIGSSFGAVGAVGPARGPAIAPSQQQQPPAPAVAAAPAYGYTSMPYTSDSEQNSPQHLAHLPPSSNFGMMGGEPADSKNKRRRGNLPKPVTDILRAWFHDHLDHPYPSEEDKQMFMTRTGLSISQISNWFINARRRQLPALRNQMRNGGSEAESRRQSPLSDTESTQDAISPTRGPNAHRS
ncbi:hypothetical protein ASPZODRAFT_154060 [Penicilliopsis zonata CBS 506.65]|uniref:Homeobox domain-containing protein n=1 Tax=Penicilliopsis zonata CBS 506.65 TaxID=1073090 RepID=A0A1L9SAA3_9EURO|nr:hypothetical protein ASPZODRAFT_154060 [Penicilliopsis zonata CBS 506.65]OJJ44094.1 hypothetical protein ASPZODRAFT_154060 [Penicilliopsis zonata CBS 506.65]